MPREQIRGELLPFPDSEEDAEALVNAVDVSWSREAEFVQLTTKTIYDSDGGDYYPPSIEVTPSVPVGNIHYSYSSGGASSTATSTELISPGQYVQLDRPAINRLIRVLRRARDQAFGKDE